MVFSYTMRGRITYLLEQRLKQQLTMQEAEELLGILRQQEHEEAVTDILSDLAQAEPDRMELEPILLKARTEAILMLDRPGIKAAPPVHRIHFLKTAWFRYAAAAVLLFATVSIYYYNQRQADAGVAEQLPPATLAMDIEPGGTLATLTLADGTKIALDTAANGSLAKQGSTQILKVQQGQLAYETRAHSSGKVLYNTINTPRGGQYQVVLQDGTKVWLNAASSLHFPTSFTGKNREVEVSGEAYFEIAANAKMPFFVKVNGMAVEVLGTKFNVNAYTDEPSIKTTLLEGSVRVRKNKEAAMLAPGQQASLTQTGNIDIDKNADVDGAVAWKNGLFRMTSSDIPTIMRQLARWYDVEVAFEDGVPVGHITGEVPRNTNLSKVLKVFQTSGIHFRIEGKTIVVTK